MTRTGQVSREKSKSDPGPDYIEARAWALRQIVEALDDARTQAIPPYDFELVAERLLAACTLVTLIARE